MKKEINNLFGWTEEQLKRLNELGAETELLEKEFKEIPQRNKSFQKEEKDLVAQTRLKFNNIFENPKRPPVLEVADKLSAILRGLGFLEVQSPIIMARKRLMKMGNDPLFLEQVFWLDEKRCLRPMLAPHLYEFMLDLNKFKAKPFGIFEIGSCFRKESQGAKHANEFTMLNLVEVGTPLEERGARLNELIKIIMEGFNISGWQKIVVESSVYGETVDLLNKDGLELASASMGPHKLDEKWGFTESWVGIGLGLERLTMTLENLEQLIKVGKNLSYLYGLPLKL